MTNRLGKLLVMAALATCLRNKGYDVDDPTADTLDQWGAAFRAEFDGLTRRQRKRTKNAAARISCQETPG